MRSSLAPSIRSEALRHPTAGMTTLYLVRHGQTRSNARRTLCGRLDVPLSGAGARQARAIAARLGNGVGADALLSSPLQRAMNTAWPIGDRLGLEPIPVTGLAEMSFGALEGFPIERIPHEHPELARRLADLDDAEFTWPGGESRRSFHVRVHATFDAILTYYAAHAVVVVAHSGVIGSFLAQLRGLRLSDPRTFNVGNCALTHLEVTVETTWIHRLNDATHLGLLRPHIVIS